MSGSNSISNRDRMTLIHTRYVILLCHLIMVISLLFNRKPNVIAGLPYEYTEDEYDATDKDFIIDLSLSVGLLLIEFLTFGSGLTMFSSLSTVISIMLHFISTVLLAFWSVDEWDSGIFWWVFGIGTCVPLAMDFGTILGNLMIQNFKYK